MRNVRVTIWVVVVLVAGTLFVKTPVVSAVVEYMYASPVTVIETITDIGGGSYEYEYSFTNVDTSPIWDFVVYTTFTPTDSSVSSFAEYPDWLSDIKAITDILPEYDARNLDPDISHLVGTFPQSWENFDSGIQPGQTVSGFSFTSNHYDLSPKYYGYETFASGWAHENGGMVAAAGQTVPEPSTLLLIGMGGLMLRKRRSGLLRRT